MAALAVAGVLNALLIDECVDVFEIPRGAEAVRVNRLTPLAIGLLVAVAAILGRVKVLGAQELTVGGGRVRGKKRSVFAESVVVARGNRIMECGRWPRNACRRGIGRSRGRICRGTVGEGTGAASGAASGPEAAQRGREVRGVAIAIDNAARTAISVRRGKAVWGAVSYIIL